MERIDTWHLAKQLLLGLRSGPGTRRPSGPNVWRKDSAPRNSISLRSLYTTNSDRRRLGLAVSMRSPNHPRTSAGISLSQYTHFAGSLGPLVGARFLGGVHLFRVAARNGHNAGRKWIDCSVNDRMAWYFLYIRWIYGGLVHSVVSLGMRFSVAVKSNIAGRKGIHSVDWRCFDLWREERNAVEGDLYVEGLLGSLDYSFGTELVLLDIANGDSVIHESCIGV